MNNETLQNSIIQVTYESTLQVYAYLGSFAILVYASLLHFPDEVEYIWKPKFTLPTYLYLLSKYPLFFYIALIVVQDLTTAPLGLCNVLGILSGIISILPFWGVQGLITIRTYALCQGYRPMAMTLFIMFLIVSASRIYGITIPVCIILEPSRAATIFALVAIILTILLDIIAFFAVVHQTRELWKLKKSLKLQSNEDLVTSLLRQGILRFTLVLLITTTQVFFAIFVPFVEAIIGPFQNILSSILMCEFTLALRRRNATREVPNLSALHLPTLSSFREDPVQSVRFVLERLHESVVIEMSERNDPVDTNGSFAGQLHEIDIGGETLPPFTQELRLSNDNNCTRADEALE